MFFGRPHSVLTRLKAAGLFVQLEPPEPSAFALIRCREGRLPREDAPNRRGIWDLEGLAGGFRGGRSAVKRAHRDEGRWKGGLTLMRCTAEHGRLDEGRQQSTVSRFGATAGCESEPRYTVLRGRGRGASF